MKFTLSWLKKFLQTDSSLDSICEVLTDVGLEVEDVCDRAQELGVFEVAEIVSASPHPSADKLQVCEVKSSSGVLQIVCGAPNARAGIKVVLAKVGTVIPAGQFKIRESEIRGVKSCGMMCSEAELEVGGNSSGIIELPLDAVIGESFVKYYGLDDPMIHINVTPNRGDALSVYGVARDLAARGIGILQELIIPEVKAEFEPTVKAQVNDSNLCSQFLYIELKDITNRESPAWLKSQLMNVGISSISAVVDVVNYVCLALGQPMHAYDADKLKGQKLVVEPLASAAKFDGLNGKEYELQAGDLVIRDDENIQCLAGIIGGADSAVTMETKRIVLEAAVFDAGIIAKSGRRLDIITDSRYRFERKIDPAMTQKALQLAANMILEICQGKASSVAGRHADKKIAPTVECAIEDLQNVTGVELEASEVLSILQKLGFIVQIQGSNLKVTPPSWRHDITIKEDIAEEVLRIEGYDKIIPQPLLLNINPVIPKMHNRYSDARRIMATCGYDEVVSWSFVDAAEAGFYGDVKDELMLKNPISSDLGYMRSTIIPNLLKMVSKNAARSIKNLALFELGPVFRGAEPEDEYIHLTAVKCGLAQPRNCHETPRTADIFDIKADLEDMLYGIGFSLEKCQISKCDLRYYHPQRSGTLSLGKNVIGHFGQLHPMLLKRLDIEEEIVAFEINMGAIPLGKPKYGKREEFKASDFQPSKRDYAFVMDEKQAVGEVLSYIANIDKKLIRNVEVFDIYKGMTIEPGFKSVALNITLQADDKTLTEEELVAISSKVIQSVEQKFAAKLRW